MSEGLFVLVVGVGAVALLAVLTASLPKRPKLSHRFLIPALGGPALPLLAISMHSALVSMEQPSYSALISNYLILALLLGIPSSFLMLHLLNFLRERRGK